MISASQEDKAMDFCLREPQDSAADCHNTTQPDVDAAVSHDASEKPERRICSRVYVRPAEGKRARYEREVAEDRDRTIHRYHVDARAVGAHGVGLKRSIACLNP